MKAILALPIIKWVYTRIANKTERGKSIEFRMYKKYSKRLGEQK